MQKSGWTRLQLAASGAALVLSVGVLWPDLAGLALGAGAFLAGPVPAVQAALQLAAPTEVPVSAPVQQPLDTPAPVAPPTAAPLPETTRLDWVDLPEGTAPEGAGAVREKTYTQSAGGVFVACGNATIRNNTKTTGQAAIAAAVNAGLPFSVEVNSALPQVLILHTHATETYRTHTGLWYAPGDTARSTDTAVNMCAVGAVMAQVLNEAGINTVHDTTLNDYPSYNASYGNSRAVAQKWLAAYPSIKVILDVHRDAIEDNGTRMAPVAQIAGRDAAQVMIISGADNGTTVPLPNCMQNLAFAAQWQAAMEADYPGLTRPVLYSHRYYNQDLSTGALLLEVGGHGNNLNQALYAGRLAAQALAKVLAGG